LTHLARVLALNEGRRLIRLSNLKERMFMNLVSFASFTEVKVGAHAALVSNTLNWTSSTSVAGNSIMNLRSLVSSSLAKMINHQSLERLSSVGFDLLLDNLNKIRVELVLESARAIASSAWHSFLVDFGTITLKAHDAFIIVDGFFFVLGAKNLTVNFLRDGFSLELATLTLSLDGTIAESFTDILHSLRTDILGIDYRVELLLIGTNKVGVASDILQIDIVSGSSHCLRRYLHGAFISNSNTVLMRE
jgi:hypothetical protein